MARRAFSSTSSSDAAGCAPFAADAPPDGAAAVSVASAFSAGCDEPFMKYQPAPASASTPTTAPMIRPIGLPDFSSPPLLELDGAVIALRASAVEEIRAASLTARM